MKKCLILFLSLYLLLSACGREMIGSQRAIDLAFAEAQQHASVPITKDMALCEQTDGFYQVSFDAKTEETLGYSAIVTVRLDVFTGEVVDVLIAK